MPLRCRVGWHRWLPMTDDTTEPSEGARHSVRCARCGQQLVVGPSGTVPQMIWGFRPPYQ
jgi:hypothetical protein